MALAELRHLNISKRHFDISTLASTTINPPIDPTLYALYLLPSHSYPTMARRSATPSAAATGSSTPVPAAAASTPVATPAPKTTSTPSSSSSSSQGNAIQNVVDNLLSHYQKATPQRTKLLDAFMVFLVAVGALQFVYCVLAGNYVRPVDASNANT